MRIAVAGATGNIGSLVLAALREGGHDVVAISRSRGIDLTTGRGLDLALNGVDAVIDVVNGPAGDRDAAVAYFAGMARNLLSAEQAAGVGHHILLSIVGLDRVRANAHYAAKREQESIVRQGAVPWTIVRATQFHDFPAMVTEWSERDGVARVPPMLMQPIAPGDVAEALVDVAVSGQPLGRCVEVAGPETQDFVDMARRTNDARGRSIELIPTWSGMFGLEMAGDVLLPSSDARIMPTRFDEWLDVQGAAT